MPTDSGAQFGEANLSNCCCCIFAHKAPRECTTETEAQRAARFEAMRRNIQQFLSQVRP